MAIVKRPDRAKGFVLPHRRWVVERSFARLTKFRGLIRNSETLPATPKLFRAMLPRPKVRTRAALPPGP